MRRPRFSLKWLLIIVTFAALLFYVALVRPTIVANKLVAEVESGDRTKHKLICEEYFGFGSFRSDMTLTVDLLPRNWLDAFKCQRRIVLVATYPEGRWQNIVDGNVVSTPFGFRNLGGRFWTEKATVPVEPKTHAP